MVVNPSGRCVPGEERRGEKEDGGARGGARGGVSRNVEGVRPPPAAPRPPNAPGGVNAVVM